MRWTRRMPSHRQKRADDRDSPTDRCAICPSGAGAGGESSPDGAPNAKGRLAWRSSEPVLQNVTSRKTANEMKGEQEP